MIKSIAFKMFSAYTEPLIKLFPEIKDDLVKSKLRYSPSEYLSIAIFVSFVAFLLSLPVFSFFYGLFFATFLFSFIFSITTSIVFAVLIFFFFLNYPKILVSMRSRKINQSLPFAMLYLSAIMKSRISFVEGIKIFTKFGRYEEIVEEFEDIINDIEFFGLDINTALENAIKRSPSKQLSDVLVGILSVLKSGADLGEFLEQKSRSLMDDYRRELYEFSKNLTIYIEIYLTAIVLGAIFFTILTSIISIIGGVITDIVIFQFILMFVFLPAVSLAFLYLVKASTPKGE